MEDDASTWDGKGCPIEIKVTEKAGMGREFGLAPGGTEEIQGGVTLGEEVIPCCQRKCRVRGSQTGDEVVLPGLDGPFCSIATMLVSRDTLEVNIVFAEGIFYIYGALVVKEVQFRCIAVELKFGENA
jgi:hypothetical protein